MRVERFGDLKAVVVGGTDGSGGGDGPLVVLLHGYGAPGDDLVAIGEYLGIPGNVRFLYPEAPLAVDYGRAWWMLDPQLFERRARGERIDRSEDVPDTLAQVREQLADFLEHAEQRLDAPRDHMLLGGFSQGSMLACDAALHADVKPKALILLSSTLIARRVWEPRMATLKDVPILQTHGRYDPLLAYDDALRLRELLQQSGATVTFVPFEGGHEIPLVAMQALRSFIVEHTGAGTR